MLVVTELFNITVNDFDADDSQCTCTDIIQISVLKLSLYFSGVNDGFRSIFLGKDFLFNNCSKLQHCSRREVT